MHSRFQFPILCWRVYSSVLKRFPNWFCLLLAAVNGYNVPHSSKPGRARLISLWKWKCYIYSEYLWSFYVVKNHLAALEHLLETIGWNYGRLHASGPGAGGQKEYHPLEVPVFLPGNSLGWTAWTCCLTLFPFLYTFYLNEAIIIWCWFPQPRNIPISNSGYYSGSNEYTFYSQRHQFWWPVAIKIVKIQFICKHSYVFSPCANTF